MSFEVKCIGMTLLMGCASPALAQTMLTLPGDPLHPATPDEDVPVETRFVLDQGRWRAIERG